MSRWLAIALEAQSQTSRCISEPCADCANCAKTPPDEASRGGFGTNGTFGTASSITGDEIRSRFAWTSQRLQEEHSRSPERARDDALRVLRADLVNDARLAPSQPDSRLCLICGRPATPTRVLIPVLTARDDDPVWLHGEPCHAEHLSRRRQMVEEFIEAAFMLTRPPQTWRGGAGAKSGALRHRPVVPLNAQNARPRSNQILR